MSSSGQTISRRRPVLPFGQRKRMSGFSNGYGTRKVQFHPPRSQRDCLPLALRSQGIAPWRGSWSPRASSRPRRRTLLNARAGLRHDQRPASHLTFRDNRAYHLAAAAHARGNLRQHAIPMAGKNCKNSGSRRAPLKKTADALQDQGAPFSGGRCYQAASRRPSDAKQVDFLIGIRLIAAILQWEGADRRRCKHIIVGPGW